MKKANLVISLMLCGLLSVPAYAGSEDSLKHKTSDFLGRAEKARKAAMYATVIAGGVAGFFASNYYLICKPGWKFYKNKGPSKSRDDKEETPLYGKVFCGGVFDLASLAIMGYGIRGLKKVLDEKPQPERVAQMQVKKIEQEPEERVDQIVNGAKKAARFGSRIAAYSFVTTTGVVLLFVGIGNTSWWVFNKNQKQTWTEKAKRIPPSGAIGTAIAGTAGISAITLGIAGLIKTCKRKHAAKKAEAHEVAIQTDETQDVAVQTNDARINQ